MITENWLKAAIRKLHNDRCLFTRNSFAERHLFQLAEEGCNFKQTLNFIVIPKSCNTDFEVVVGSGYLEVLQFVDVI